jgi:hypothetical protein
MAYFKGGAAILEDDVSGVAVDALGGDVVSKPFVSHAARRDHP